MIVASAEAAHEAPRRRRVGVEGQRRRIVAAATIVFAQRGVDGASVEHLLEAAEISRQTFYRCFRNKEEVVHAIHDDVTRRLMETMSPLQLTAAGCADPIDARIDQFFAYAKALGPIVCELEREAMRPSSPFAKHHELRVELGIAYLAGWLRTDYGAAPPATLLRGLAIAFASLFLDVASGRPGGRARLKTAKAVARALVRAALGHVDPE